MDNKVLLHACCATCSAYPIELLREMGYEPVVYFFNPNIFPPDEFEKRLSELIRYSEKKNVELIVDQQDASNWYTFIAGLEYTIFKLCGFFAMPSLIALYMISGFLVHNAQAMRLFTAAHVI